MDTVTVTTASADYLAATRVRRTCYQLTAKSTITDDQIFDIVKHAVLHTPSSFNIQPLRAVVLLGDNHKKFWGIVVEALRQKLSAERFPGSEAHINGAFTPAYGTILYFTDTAVTAKAAQDHPSYAANFPLWADNSQGILQATVWTALALEGMRASLQHYHPLIDEAVRQTWGFPETWKLSAQAPFGVPAEGWTPANKAVVPLSERALIFK
jgi:predicted oxidoreductase (fatty acid repression mutant protein)